MSVPYDVAERFVDWLTGEAVASARGDRTQVLAVAPEGRFWLGRLAPEIKVQQSRLGERAERLEPCAVGMRVRPDAFDGRRIRCQARMVAWRRVGADSDDPDAIRWRKSERIDVGVELAMPTQLGERTAVGRGE